MGDYPCLTISCFIDLEVYGLSKLDYDITLFYIVFILLWRIK
jgi:hypothetical protein